MEAIKELVKIGIGAGMLAPWIARAGTRERLARVAAARAAQISGAGASRT